MQETSHTLTVSPSGFEPDFNSLRNSFDMTTSEAPVVKPQGPPRESNGMTFTSPKLGSQSVRRPYGCAVVELAQFASQSGQMLMGNGANSSSMSRLSTQTGNTPSNVFEPPTNRYTMNIFSPVSEARFPTLHEDIIASRTKEFFGSGNLTSAGPGTHLSGTKNHPPTQVMGPKNESIEIQMKTYYGNTNTILKENNSVLSDVPVTP
jgi:dedicator of cytokinesis protein 3